MPAYNDRLKNRNRFEQKMDGYNHTMEFVRTVVPIIVLCLQVWILIKLSN